MKGKFNFKLSVVGPINNVNLRSLMNRDYIIHYNSLGLNEIAQLLRQTDIFLYSHLNPPCPNSVIEAISTGLPVVGFDSGSMSELCYFSKELLAEVSNDIFQRYEDFDYMQLADKIEKVIDEYEKFKEIALAYSQVYSFEVCGNKYVDVFNRILSN